MNKRIVRKLKPLIYPILFFFCWTNLGLYNIVYAATKDRSQKPGVRSQKKDKSTEEKLEETLERIKKKAEKAEEKAKRGEDVEEEEREIEKEKAEIETLDVEIKKKFKETEDKIKDLPEEIKQRHRDFVREYEENLRELKKDLDDIEKAKTKEEKEQSHKKLKDFLEKKKPPKKHTPLDPNKLPHRTPKIEKKEPRLDYSSQDSVVSSQEKTERQEPILVAANGPLTGLLSPDSELLTPNSELITQNLLIAQATTDLPTPADLSETIEVQFTQEITDLATQLNNNPVQVYEWVRNNIEFVPTYGSIQGAQMCLWTKECNAFDTASLLIALLRASNIPARYVYGTIELPIDKVMNWVGGFTDARAAATFIASGGIPVKVIISGGEIAKVQMEHVWVEGYIPYGNYRGTMIDQTGKTWIPMDGSYKQYSYTGPVDVKTITGFDPQAIIDQLQSTATVDPTTGSVTNMDSLYIQSQLTQAQSTLLDYVNTNIPQATVKEVFGGKTLVQENLGLLSATLPYKRIVTLQKNSEISDTMRHKVTFTITDEWGISTIINATKTLPEIASKKVTLSYAPASPADEALIQNYADAGTIEYPAYLINLKPELKIEEVTIATGGVIGMGKEQFLKMSFITPGYGSETVTNSITAGTFYAIGLDVGIIPQKMFTDRKTKLEGTKAILDAGSVTGITKEDTVGDMLYLTLLNYFTQLDAYNRLNEPGMGVVSNRLPSEGITGFELKVSYMWGVPRTASFGGLSIDIDRDMKVVSARDGDKEKVKQFMVISGMRSSALEHSIFEQMYGSETDPAYGVSAVKIIAVANNTGIPIYTVDQTNINIILPLLQVSQEVKTDIQNAVNAGKVVTIPETEINYHGWQGVGYIVMDSNTGAAAYMISGGIAGGWLGWIVGGVILLLSYGIVMMLAFPPVSVVAVIGAVLVGLGIGLFASQLLTEDPKVRGIILDVWQILVGGILAAEIGLSITVFTITPLFYIVLAAFILSYILDYLGLIGQIRRKELQFRYA